MSICPSNDVNDASHVHPKLAKPSAIDNIYNYTMPHFRGVSMGFGVVGSGRGGGVGEMFGKLGFKLSILAHSELCLKCKLNFYYPGFMY